MVRFSAICIDVTNPAAAASVASFWAAALGGAATEQGHGGMVVHIDGELPMYVDPVPEPKMVKNRFHPDLHASVAELVELGAVELARHGAFTLCADPAGNEFCAFPVDDPVSSAPAAPTRIFAWCVDSADPVRSAAWWHRLLGGDLGPGPDGTPRYLRGAAGLGSKILKFVPVSDPRSVKNRWHWDVETSTADELVRAGATIQRVRDGEIHWTVMHDPDGHVFCAFEPDQWVGASSG